MTWNPIFFLVADFMKLENGRKICLLQGNISKTHYHQLSPIIIFETGLIELTIMIKWENNMFVFVKMRVASEYHRHVQKKKKIHNKPLKYKNNLYKIFDRLGKYKVARDNNYMIDQTLSATILDGNVSMRLTASDMRIVCVHKVYEPITGCFLNSVVVRFYSLVRYYP